MIKARVKAQNKEANLRDYVECRKRFSWEEVEKRFTYHETGRINMVYEAIDVWADDPLKGDRTALVFEMGGKSQHYTYRDLKEKSCQWSHLFSSLGMNMRDRLFIFLPPCPEIYFAMLGSVRAGVIFSPLYATLNYEILKSIILNGRPRFILTTSDLAEELPLEVMDDVDSVLFVDDFLPGIFRKEVSVPKLVDDMPKDGEPVWVDRDFPVYIIYTSGSTGPPKGVVHAHKDMTGYYATGRYVLDMSEGTVLWTDGGPAWITGTVYSAFSPWLCGAVSVVQGDVFSASTWYRTLERYGVSVWYTTPSIVRRLMKAGDDLPGRYDLSHLRHIATVGEHLGPELFFWVRKNMGLSPHDTWWMSETGIICIANFPSMDIKPGSMGRPVPGIEAAILDEEGNELPFMTMGELAIKTPWPGLMSGIWGGDDQYEEYFRFSGWFMTGDMALKDEEGYYYHHGRMDDLIKVGEKRVGPYEIEQVLCQHPAVWEAAVISRSMDGESPVLKAFVSIKNNYRASKRLKREIRSFVLANFSPDLPLKEIEILDRLPRTGTGKLLRRVLRARELGLET